MSTPERRRETVYVRPVYRAFLWDFIQNVSVTPPVEIMICLVLIGLGE